VGVRVQLRDGANAVFGSTTILDVEPKPATGCPLQRGEYVLVRGGKAKAGVAAKTSMQTVSGWDDVQLFKRPTTNRSKKLVLAADKYPGVLKDTWALFSTSMSPGDLMKVDQFLIDRQHTYLKPPAPKKKAKATSK
jgi:hypothetical protein